MIKTILLRITAASTLLITAACASTNPNTPAEVYDPLENVNRATHSFNQGVDKALVRPFTAGYRAVVPEAPRQGIANAMRNLREPWTFVNDILQLKFLRAGKTLGRFVVNTTFGVGGLFKASDSMGIEYHSEDLGQTLAVWGVGDTPYIVLPFLGPSNGRDAIGFGAYVFADPVTIGISKLNEKGMNLARTGVDALTLRERNFDTINGALDDPDSYELMRSAYRQYRRYEIFDGNPPEEDSDIFDDLEDDEFEEGLPQEDQNK